jgi:hypothetical protein
MALSGVFISQDGVSAGRLQRARSPPATNVARRRSTGQLSTREVILKADCATSGAGRRMAAKSPDGKTGLAVAGSTSKPASRSMQYSSRGKGSEAREEAAQETLRVVECALKDVQAALQKSAPVSVAAASQEPPPCLAPGLAATAGHSEPPPDFAAVADAAAKAVAVATAIATGAGARQRPATRQVESQVSSLAAARESYKARVRATERSARFTDGLLEKIEGLRDDVCSSGGSCSSFSSSTGLASSRASTRACSPATGTSRVSTGSSCSLRSWS